jgi:hypothetical protein
MEIQLAPVVAVSEQCELCNVRADVDVTSESLLPYLPQVTADSPSGQCF